MRRSRGIQCVAWDGHVCHSLGEKTVDDLLARAAIPHEREPRYPDGSFRADWCIGSTLVEYYGLAGDEAYDARRATKEALAHRHGIAVFGILPMDLMNPGGLLHRLQVLTAQRCLHSAWRVTDLDKSPDHRWR